MEHEVDVAVIATGYDVVRGSTSALHIQSLNSVAVDRPPPC
jgi:hypothetical protein